MMIVIKRAGLNLDERNKNESNREDVCRNLRRSRRNRRGQDVVACLEAFRPFDDGIAAEPGVREECPLFFLYSRPSQKDWGAKTYGVFFDDRRVSLEWPSCYFGRPAGGEGRLTCLPHLLAVRPAQVTSRWALVGPLWISDCRFSQEPSIFGLTSRCTATYVTSRVSQSSSRRGTQWTSRSTRRSAQPTCHVTPSELRIGCGG